MKFENTRVYNFENALRGMRNPLNSWAKSDSEYGITPWEYLGNKVSLYYDKINDYCEYVQIGPNDMDLARRLINGGTEHRKFLRQIFVSVDITAPLYWYKEFDTYKVATAANSTSTMHKIASAPITLDCFEIGDYEPDLVYYTSDNGDNEVEYTVSDLADSIIENLELLRQKYLETKDKRYWKELIRWLPEGWNQTRTWTANYEVLRSMYHQREHHKLCEWSDDFCKWIESLPYAKELIID